MTTTRIAIVTVTVALLAASLVAQPKDVASREEIRRFLSTAAIVEVEPLRIGVTRSSRAMLDDGTRRHPAHVQTVDLLKRGYPGPRRVYPFFRDSYRYNVAASVLDDMLGLGLVPVSVERKIGKQRAAVTWWVDDVLMMEADRIRGGTAPARPGEWVDQLGQTRVFSALVANADFNPTNLLITDDWKLWMIDFTRAFRVDDWVELEPEELPRLDRRFYEGLRRLDAGEVRERLGRLLSKTEIKTLWVRRNAILDLYGQAIAQRGETVVICDRPGH